MGQNLIQVTALGERGGCLNRFWRELCMGEDPELLGTSLVRLGVDVGPWQGLIVLSAVEDPEME